MNPELKSEFVEHQTLQDVIINKIRNTIKKQEAKENPFKFFRLTTADGKMSYFEPSKWTVIEVDRENIHIYVSSSEGAISIYKDDQKDDDFAKLLNYMNQNSVSISELVNHWDRYFTRLRQIYLRMSEDSNYIKLSKIRSVQFGEQNNETQISIYIKSPVNGYVLVYESDNLIAQDFKKMMELLSQ